MLVAFQHLNALLEAAVEDRLDRREPGQGVKLPELTVPEVIPPTTVQVQAIYEKVAEWCRTLGRRSDPSPPQGGRKGRYSALEQELLVVFVEEQGDLVEQVGMGLEAARAVDDLERHPAGLLDPLAVAA